MRIAHICLSCFYNDGMNYQENQLVRQHVADGHDVLVLASTEVYNDKGQLTYRDPGDYMGTDGARVIRLPYSTWLPHKVMRKLRFHPGVYDQIKAFAPDAILFHGGCGAEIVTVARYVRDHPETIFYVDSHEDWTNSAKNFVSREILHRMFYGNRLRKALPQIDMVLCVTTDTMDFVEDLYRVSRDKLEFYPLGGYPLEDADYHQRREAKRAELGIAPDMTLYAQTGKMRPHKRLSETLRAFKASAGVTDRFAIGGVLLDETRDEVERLVAEDPRVVFLGWQSVEDLTDLLCAADIYLHPGRQSSTTQHSMCCRCALVLEDLPAHWVFVKETGWLVGFTAPLEPVFADAQNSDIEQMKQTSYALACSMLDYEVLAQRVLHRTSKPQNNSAG
mgnify:CR=1 FL=1